MKNSKTFVKTLALALLAGAGLSGCVAVPYGSSPYGAPAYGYGHEAYAPQVYSAPAIVVPSIRLGLDLGYSGRRYRGGSYSRW